MCGTPICVCNQKRVTKNVCVCCVVLRAPACCALQVAGADGKVDKAEFVRLFRTLLAKIKGHPEPVAEAALEQGYVAPE